MDYIHEDIIYNIFTEFEEMHELKVLLNFSKYTWSMQLHGSEIFDCIQNYISLCFIDFTFIFTFTVTFMQTHSYTLSLQL